jgi:hypothetical protein
MLSWAVSSSNAYMREYMKRRYHQRRAIALKKLGGKCACCPSKRGLEVDHKDRAKKTMTFTHMRSVSLVKFMKELENCQLLCRRCHEKKTRADLGQPPKGTHGTYAMYRHGGCRCVACVYASRAYQRAWSKKSRAQQANAE